MHSNSHLVSVIIPCFNQAKYLAECIECLIKQSHSDWQAIIIDDGSTDETPQVAKELSNLDQRIKYVRKHNGGPSSARNQGLLIANGDYIQFLDADDLILPDKLRAQIEFFYLNPDYGVVYSDFDFFTDPFLICPTESFATWETSAESGDIWNRLLASNPITIHSALIRKSALLAQDLFDDRINSCEDYLFWLRLSARHTKFGYLPTKYALYRRHEGSLTYKRITMIKGNIKVIETIPRLGRDLTSSDRSNLARQISNLYDELAQLYILNSSYLGSIYMALISIIYEPKSRAWRARRLKARLLEAIRLKNREQAQ